MSEEQFWNMEPKVFISILSKHKEIKIEQMKTQSLFTSCFIWGKNPDDYINSKKEIPGVDIPVNPELLRGFYG